jgi:hypothetical protein
MNLGCSDGGCLFQHNTGQVTNGGCNCVRGQASWSGGEHGWAIREQKVRIMIARAVQVAIEKEYANNGRN